jgi:D-glycero-D-manno-heptose 1,7-bisphosphate phosphatase
MARRQFVVLDRDGTVIVERNYLSNPDQVELLPGAAAGLRRLKERGFGLVIVTNQSGIGRGYYDEAALTSIHNRLQALLSAQGVQLDGIYHCPHVPEDDCACRKPQTGLLEKAASDLDFEPSAAIVIGDKPCDIDLGRAVGADTILVRTGYGARYAMDKGLKPKMIADDLLAAAAMIENWSREALTIEADKP